MHLILQPVSPLGGGVALTRQIEAFLQELLAADSDALREVTVRHGLGAESEDDDVHCDLRARLASGARVTVAHSAATLVKALHGAVGKLREAVRADEALDLVV